MRGVGRVALGVAGLGVAGAASLGLALGGGAAWAADAPMPDEDQPAPQRLFVEVAAPFEEVLVSVQARVTRGGATRVLTLVDDGSDPADVAWDGVWTASDDGPWARTVNVELLARTMDGNEHLVWAGLVGTTDRYASVLAWQVRVDAEGLRARQVVAAWPGDTLVIPDGLRVYVGFGWGCFLVALVTGLYRTREER